MLLELKDSSLTLDSNPVVSDVRINIPADERRFRLKLKYVEGCEDELVDILVTHYSVPSFSIKSTSLSMSVEGVEKLRDVRFRFKLTFNLLKMRLNVSSTIPREVDASIYDIVELLRFIKRLIL